MSYREREIPKRRTGFFFFFFKEKNKKGSGKFKTLVRAGTAVKLPGGASENLQCHKFS